MANKKFMTAKEHLDKKYGIEGSESRLEFKDKAMSYYYGSILKERRKELNLTQEDLANKIHRNRTYIARVEKGETDLQLSSLTMLLNALGLDLQIGTL
ncbi:MAG: helix-turn-helix domain-containing protein [Flavobacteriales bacterium]|nr:helix-turn-helix domain-containing protein [Flavobacteriales bacterium]